MARQIGVLALQGNFEKHQVALHDSGVETIQVKKPEHLKVCDGLVIPGGESTTITKLMSALNLYDSIIDFASHYPIMGTCAGIILLASYVDDNRVKPLKLLDATVTRNAYGRQIDSFIIDLEADFMNNSDGHHDTSFKSIFIRAPRIIKTGKNVVTLIKLNNESVMVQENNILGLTFHPELTEDYRIHKYFLTI